MAFLSAPTGPCALSTAPLHSDPLTLVGHQCTAEHVNVVSEHFPTCLGDNTSIKRLHENAIKSFFLRMAQSVLEDSVRKK